METFSALLSLCEGNSPVTGEFPSQRPVTRSFDVFFDLCLNKRLSKPSRRRWFETPSRSLWRHCNVSRKTLVDVIFSKNIGMKGNWFWDQNTATCVQSFCTLINGVRDSHDMSSHCNNTACMVTATLRGNLVKFERQHFVTNSRLVYTDVQGCIDVPQDRRFLYFRRHGQFDAFWYLLGNHFSTLKSTFKASAHHMHWHHMSAKASQITGNLTVFSRVCSY